ncbi:GNAT family N-acetyltransferase [Flavobacterium nitrogenifigens]|uniref:Predicted N-acetyltransferase YhbS n=1 Tax=Flavobacterium nitrogenifigens TaxID=1617283 RepID=A0A521AJZ9_9FLAO|nr:N-acetyltransferase [Flavobacterium nitrogenifigens]KAF2331614.1 N-acetyltransferase [Flavobacterium nitrogenifigens]SMO35154.1 Predicted N-acetyltransferase YhbS [Flavobacterium nitrogenifigens]
MEIILRQENKNDFESVFHLIEKAFEKEEYSDHKEQFLVERLRKSDAFIPELSIVAEIDNKIVGHILFTKLEIKSESQIFQSLALAPVSVLPEFQGKGIGSKLILHGHEIAKGLGYKSVILLGHQDYYPRFGYELCEKYNIKMPFDVPAENCMVIALVEDGLKGISGEVVYPSAFFE